jgi:hypothetical protein
MGLQLGCHDCQRVVNMTPVQRAIDVYHIFRARLLKSQVLLCLMIKRSLRFRIRIRSIYFRAGNNIAQAGYLRHDSTLGGVQVNVTTAPGVPCIIACAMLAPARRQAAGAIIAPTGCAAD